MPQGGESGIFRGRNRCAETRRLDVPSHLAGECATLGRSVATSGKKPARLEVARQPKHSEASYMVLARSSTWEHLDAFQVLRLKQKGAASERARACPFP